MQSIVVCPKKGILDEIDISLFPKIKNNFTVYLRFLLFNKFHGYFKNFKVAIMYHNLFLSTLVICMFKGKPEGVKQSKLKAVAECNCASFKYKFYIFFNDILVLL